MCIWGWNYSNLVHLKWKMEYGPVGWSSWFILPTEYCLKGNCPTLDRDAPWPYQLPCWVFEMETILSSYKSGSVSLLGPMTWISGEGGGIGENFLLLTLGLLGSGY